MALDDRRLFRAMRPQIGGQTMTTKAPTPAVPKTRAVLIGPSGRYAGTQETSSLQVAHAPTNHRPDARPDGEAKRQSTVRVKNEILTNFDRNLSY